MLRGLVPPEVLLNQETTPDWLNHVTLGVPYDQELVESERLRPFGNIGLWAELSDDLGLQDFLPLNSNQVVLASSHAICLVDDTTPLAEICAPGPRTIELSAIDGVDAPETFTGLAQRPQGGGPIYALARSPGDVTAYIIRFAVTESALENLQVVTSSSSAGSIVRHIAVSEEGTLSATVETSGRRETGSLSALSIQMFDEASGEWRNSPFRRLDPASLTVKGISALRDNNQTFVWTSHNDGQLLRHTLGGGLGAPNVRLVMPDEYVENCEPRASSNGNLLFSDIREIYVRGPHDGFALSESCAVLIWFDPNPSDPDRPHVSVFAAATLGEPWVEFGAEVVDYHIRVLNDEVWVANDGDLLRVRQPALQRGTN